VKKIIFIKILLILIIIFLETITVIVIKTIITLTVKKTKLIIIILIKIVNRITLKFLIISYFKLILKVLLFLFIFLDVPMKKNDV
jgi:hypothetical protein